MQRRCDNGCSRSNIRYASLTHRFPFIEELPGAGSSYEGAARSTIANKGGRIQRKTNEFVQQQCKPDLMAL